MNSDYTQLQKKIRDVRSRLKWIVGAKGVAISLGCTLFALLIATIGADHWNYNDRAITLARWFSAISVVLVFYRFVAKPLWTKIDDLKIARYIEERHPSLQDRLVSAIELGRNPSDRAGSQSILSLLFKDALQRTHLISPKSLFNPREPFLSSTIALAFIICFVLLQMFGPDFFQYATLKLYANWLIPQPASLYRIDILPGNSEIRKGSDQKVTARLVGFDSNDVSIYSRRENSVSWERNHMEPEQHSSRFEFLFLDINEKVHYYAQSGNVRSPEFAISVRDIAQVKRIDLTYHYPQYTGIPAHTEEDGGEISALRETTVELHVNTNIATDSANILLQDGTRIPMRKTGTRDFLGKIKVVSDSSYQIELAANSNQPAVGSLEYPITALDDQPPLISLKPGRDQKVTQLEEVVTEAKATDDYGLRSLKFYYTVNGGKEETVDLFHGEHGGGKSLSGAHTFFMEEFHLEPGDFVTYYARASDAHNSSTSDIYFLEVRPFGREYSQSQMAGGMAGGAAEAGSVLSARQREILSATWRLIRDEKNFEKTEYTDNLKLVASQQVKLQQQTKSLSDRIQRRALTTRDPEFQKLADNLLKAIEAMTPAYKSLSEKQLQAAISPEQVSLQHLLRAEAYFRQIQVAYGNGSGANGNAVGAQELENLFEMELDKLKNQYETQQQKNSRDLAAEIDEALQKLKELAQRQQQINERARQQLKLPNGSAGSGANQSQQQSLRAETEKLARQLERLSRQEEDEELLKSSQRLKQAAQEMKTSGNPSPSASNQGAKSSSPSRQQMGNSGSTSPNGGSENEGLRALSRLNDARRIMEGQQRNSLSEDLKQLRDSAKELAQKQDRIGKSIDELAQNSGNREGRSVPSGSPLEQMEQLKKKRQILQGKADLNREISGLEENLHRAVRKSSSQQKAASEHLQSAVNAMKDERVQERVTEGGQLMARGMFQAAKDRERAVQKALESVESKIRSAEEKLSQNSPTRPEDHLDAALSATGDLLENLESLNRRLRQKRPGRSSGDSSTSKRDGDTSKQNGESASPKNLEGLRVRGSGTETPENAGDKSIPSSDKSRQIGDDSQGRSSRAGSGEKGNDPTQSSSEAAESSSGPHQANTTSPQGNRNDFSGDTNRQSHGSYNRGEAAVNFGDYGLPPPSEWTREQARQFEKEYDVRLREAEEIAKSLRGRQDLSKQIQDMVEQMKRLKSGRLPYDERELERLESTVIRGLRQFEMRLSRNLQQLVSKENLHLAKDEEIPEVYQQQVEEYYKALSSK